MDKELLRQVFACIDNTTLKSTDNAASVEAFCQRTRDMQLADGTHVASVCVFPRYVDVARRVLEGSGIKVATVAGGFPYGQMSAAVKSAEVSDAVHSGADEVDVVISRGDLLGGDYRSVMRDLQRMRRSADKAVLKVILETCDLKDAKLISDAVLMATAAGADFVKTSTGKGAEGATPKVAGIMLRAVKKNVKICKKTIGFKAAGGIRTPEDALVYASLAKKIMGAEYINKQTFRIGASSLTESIFSILTF